MRVRKLLYVGLGLVGAVVVAAVVALKSIDLDTRFKALAAHAVQQATGRALAMNGAVQLSLLPVPALTVHDVALANAPWGSEHDMMRLGELSAGVDIVPLLLGHGVHIEHLLLKDVTLLLETDPQGHGNWEFATPAPGSVPPTAAPQDNGRFDLASIGDVRLDNVTLSYRDGRSGKTLSAAVQQLTLAEQGDGAIDMTAAAAVQGTPVAMTAKLGALYSHPYPIDTTIKLGGGTLAARGSVADPIAGRGLDLAVTLDGASLADLGAIAGAPLPAKPYHLAAKLSGDAAGPIALAGLQASLGGSAMAGELQLAIAGARPKLTARLDASLIDLGELLPPRAAAPAASNDGRVFSNDELPFGSLDGFDADLGLTVAELRGAAMPLKNLAVQATLDDRKLNVASFAVDLPQGHVGGKAGVLARQGPASVQLRLDTSRLDLGGLLAQLAGTDLLAAHGDVNIDVTGSGNSVRAIMATLNGSASLEVGHGTIRNRYADLIGADVFRQAFAWAQGKQDVALDCMAARFGIRDGIATANGLLMDTDLMTMAGTGTVNLGSETLALQLVPKPKQTSLVNLATPIDVGGRLAHPTFAPNRAVLAKNVAVGVASAVNPLFLLVPLVLDSGDDNNNGCVAALAKPAPTTTEKVTGAVGGAVSGAGNAVGGAAKQLDQSLKKLFP